MHTDNPSSAWLKGLRKRIRFHRRISKTAQVSTSQADLHLSLLNDGFSILEALDKFYSIELEF